MTKNKNKSKRFRTEDSFDFSNDSSRHNSTTIVESVQQKLDDLKTTVKPELNAIMEGISLLMSLQVNTFNDVNSIKKSNQLLADKIRSNAGHIAEVKVNVAEIKKDVIKNKSEINILKQLQLENQMLAAGFPNKPEVEKSIKLICEKFEFDPKLILSSYAFEVVMKKKSEIESMETSQQNLSKIDNAEKTITRGFIGITFINKSAQILFNTQRKQFGPLVAKQFMTCKDEKSSNQEISFRYKLTKINRIVNRELGLLHRLKVISSFKYANNCFWVTEKAGEKPFVVNTLETLNILKSKLDDLSM